MSRVNRRRLTKKENSEKSLQDINPNLGLVDIASSLIEEYHFDLDTGKYEDLIPDLRKILDRFDPKNAVNVAALYLRIIFSIKRSKVRRRLSAFLRKTNVYLVAFFNNKLLEFGNNSKTPKPEQIFDGSTFIGYSENYSGLLSSVRVGYQPFLKAVITIIDQQDNQTHDVRLGWRIHLVVLMVMICEAMRYHPLFDVFLRLWNEKGERTLSKGMILFIQNWCHMTEVAAGIKTSNDYQVPDTINLDDYDQALGLKDNRTGANRVLAIRHPGRDLWKEALILSSLHHPNIVSFLYSSCWTRWLIGYCNIARDQ